jgi:hypothetical protein
MNRIGLGIVTAYGADVFTPAWLYVCTREGKTLLKYVNLRPDRPMVVAVGIFAFSVAWEFGQKIHFIGGVYDPLDIVAYGVGIGAAFLIDIWLSGVPCRFCTCRNETNSSGEGPGKTSARPTFTPN